MIKKKNLAQICDRIKSANSKIDMSNNFDDFTDISLNNKIHLFQIENSFKLQRGKMSEISLEDRVLKILQKYELPFMLDRETKGDGNCFIWAVYQQCQRPEIKDSLSAEMLEISKSQNQQQFRDAGVY